MAPNDLGCISCAVEYGTFGFRIGPLDSKQHTCEKGTGTTSSGSTASAYTFDNYQDDAGTTAIYAEANTGNTAAINYCVLGLVGEAGEIANKWKKFFRDGNVEDEQHIKVTRDNVLNELEDVLWYGARLATELGTSLGEVAADNIRKLTDRQQRGKISGSGDTR